MKRLAASFLPALVLSALLASGCSVGMAMSGKHQTDTSVLFPGAPRDVVVAKMGVPETSTINEEGLRVNTWNAVKGNEKSTGRAVAHAGMDILTLGLWEIVGTPMEMGAAGEEHTRYVITYDKTDKIKDMQAIKSPKK